MDQVSSKSPMGVYGTRENRYFKERGSIADSKRGSVHRGIAAALMSDVDITNGAYFWDGSDLRFNSHYKKWGVTFTDPKHNLWNQKNTTGRSQLETTNAIGGTVFTRFKDQGSRWYISK
jgi:hypothetical protein